MPQWVVVDPEKITGYFRQMCQLITTGRYLLVVKKKTTYITNTNRNPIRKHHFDQHKEGNRSVKIEEREKSGKMLL